MEKYEVVVVSRYPIEVAAPTEEQAKEIALGIINDQYNCLQLHWSVSEIERLKQKDEVNLCPMCSNEVDVEDELCFECESEHGNNWVVI